jgi:uncharacterized membrane protein
LTHALNLAFLHIVAGAQSDIGKDVGAFEDALAAKARDYDVDDFVHEGGKVIRDA